MIQVEKLTFNYARADEPAVRDASLTACGSGCWRSTTCRVFTTPAVSTLCYWRVTKRVMCVNCRE